MIRAQWCRPRSFIAMAQHLEAMPASFSSLRDTPIKAPLVVISAGSTVAAGVEEHRRIARLSPRGRHIVARNSGHWIQLDEPDLVADAIRSVLKDA